MQVFCCYFPQHRFTRKRIGSRNSSAWQMEWSVKFLICTILSHISYEIQSFQLEWHIRPLMNPFPCPQRKCAQIPKQRKCPACPGSSQKAHQLLDLGEISGLRGCTSFILIWTVYGAVPLFDNQTTIAGELWRSGSGFDFLPFSTRDPRDLPLCSYKDDFHSLV